MLTIPMHPDYSSSRVVVITMRGIKLGEPISLLFFEVEVNIDEVLLESRPLQVDFLCLSSFNLMSFALFKEMSSARVFIETKFECLRMSSVSISRVKRHLVVGKYFVRAIKFPSIIKSV